MRIPNTLVSLRLAALFAVLTAFILGAQAQVLYVANKGGNSGFYGVGAYDHATGQPISGFTSPNLWISGPVGVAVADGTLYIASQSTGTISTFDAATGTKVTYQLVTGLSPSGITVSGGILYTVNYVANTVGAYNAADGTPLAGFTSPSGLSTPMSVAVSGSNLYVLNAGSNTIGVYNAATGATISASYISSGLNQPQGMALSGSVLYVSNHGDDTINAFDLTDGHSIYSSPKATGFANTFGVAVSGSTLYVSSTYEGVTLSGVVGTFDASTGTAINSTFITGLNFPAQMTVGPGAAVPEPADLALFIGLAGLLTAAMLRRRRA